QHQFNANAIRQTRTLTSSTGMQRIGIHQVRLAPGCDSTTHHSHDADEEFIYVIAGEGIARIGDETYPIGPGDFMGFPAPSAAHSMTNTGSEDLVYLMGGERHASDTVHYPDLRRSMIKSHGQRTWSDWQDMIELPPRN
ncbi:MAG: cupin domain-containing protein, partial [Pseudomonadota bacterium]